MNNTAIKQVRRSLKESVDEKTKTGSQRFFKEKIKCYGVKVPTVQYIARQAFVSLKDRPKTEIFEFVMKHKATMPRTALRYAIEKMPPDIRKKAMEK